MTKEILISYEPDSILFQYWLLQVSLAVQKTKTSEPEFEIPQHLVQHVAQQVIGGGQSQYQQQQPDPSEQGYNAEYYQKYN